MGIDIVNSHSDNGSWWLSPKKVEKTKRILWRDIEGLETRGLNFEYIKSVVMSCDVLTRLILVYSLSHSLTHTHTISNDMCVCSVLIVCREYEIMVCVSVLCILINESRFIVFISFISRWTRDAGQVLNSNLIFSKHLHICLGELVWTIILL